VQLLGDDGRWSIRTWRPAGAGEIAVATPVHSMTPLVLKILT